MLVFLWPLCQFFGHLVDFPAIWHILWPSGMYIFPHFGMLYQEKSGNPAWRNRIFHKRSLIFKTTVLKAFEKFIHTFKSLSHSLPFSFPPIHPPFPYPPTLAGDFLKQINKYANVKNSMHDVFQELFARKKIRLKFQRYQKNLAQLRFFDRMVI
jgi:hypothetical protein